MKYSVKQYASALNLALKGKDGSERKKATKRFLDILRKNRDGGKLSRILKELEIQHLHSSGLNKVRIEAASPLSRKVKSEIEEIFGKKLHLEEKINPELLAGLRILVNDEFFVDASAKSRIGEILG